MYSSTLCFPTGKPSRRTGVFQTQDSLPNDAIIMNAKLSGRLFEPPGETHNRKRALCSSGGGTYAMLSTAGLIQGLYHRGLFTSQTFGYFSTSSGAGWASALVCFISDKYKDSLEEKLGTYVSPKYLTSVFLQLPLAPKRVGAKFDAGFLPNVGRALAIMQHTPLTPPHMYWEHFFATLVLSSQNIESDVNIMASTEAELRDIIYNQTYNLAPVLDAAYYIRVGIPCPVTAFTVVQYDAARKPTEFAAEINPNYVSLLGEFDANSPPATQGISSYAYNSSRLADCNGAVVDSIIRTHQALPGNVFGLGAFAACTSNLMLGVFQSNQTLKNSPFLPTMLTNSADVCNAVYGAGDGGMINDSGILAMLARKVPRLFCLINDGTLSRDAQQPVPISIAATFSTALGVFPHALLTKTVNGILDHNGIFTASYKTVGRPQFSVPGNMNVTVTWIYPTVTAEFRTALSQECLSLLNTLERVYNFPNSLNLGKNIGLETLLATSPLFANMLIALVAFMAQQITIEE